MKELHNKKRQKRILFLTALFAVVFIAGALFEFNVTMTKKEESTTNQYLTEWSEQNARMVQLKLERYYDVLEYAAQCIHNMPFDGEETEKLLEENFSRKSTDFEYFRILDKEGVAVNVDRDFSKEEYFRTAAAGKKGFAMNGNSYDNGILLSVPVYSDENEVEGVLCGILFGSRLDIFRKTGRLGKESDLYLVDKQGDYIVKREKYNKAGSNIFDDLENKDLSIILSTIEFRVRSGISVPFRARGPEDTDKDGKVIVMAPVKDTGLCTATVINARTVAKTSRTYQLYVWLLTVKILGMLAVLAGVYLYFQREDRIYIRNLNKQLALNEETYRITARTNDTCVFTYDVSTQLIQFLNDKYKDLGLEDAQMSVPVFLKRVKEINPEVCVAIGKILDTIDQEKESHVQKLTLRAGGRLRYLEILTTNIFDENGNVSRMVGSIADVTKRENDLRRLKKEEGFRNTLLSDSLGYMIVDVDNDRIIESTAAILKGNDPRDYSYTEIFSYFMSKRVRTEHWNELKELMSCRALRQLAEDKIENKTYEYLTIDHEEEDVWFSCEIHLKEDSTHHLTAYLIFRNINDEKKQQESLEKRASTDLLTGAFNRAAGSTRIEKIMEVVPDEGCVHAFAIADLDNFKKLNDVMGHMWGDKALYEVTAIMKDHCRAREDVVCRLGGDEFVVFMQNIPREAVERNIDALSRKLHITYEKENVSVTISASMGIAMTRKKDCKFQELYEEADSCLYQVKRTFKGSYHISDKIL